MKVINIILTSQNGGAEQAFIDYSTVLKNLSHQVLAIVKQDAPYADKASALGIEVKKITNHFGYHDIFAAKKIAEIMREFDADTVIAHAGRSMVLAKKAIKKIENRKIVLIAVNHSMNVKRSIGADIVLSVNREIFYRTVRFGQNEAQSFVISNATDLSDAIAVAPAIDLLAKNTITIGVMARLDRSKGFDYAVKAIKNLEKFSSEKNQKFILKLAGKGEQEAHLRRLVKDLALENSVEFLGWVKNKREFFDSIDIFCIPSRRETFGLVLLEAMKYRKPIISTDADGPKEFLRGGIDALLVSLNPPCNVEDRIAQAVIRMVSEPNLAKKMIENSFVRLNEKFSYQSLEKSLQEVVGRASIPNIPRF